jgi:hypothetical protein
VGHQKESDTLAYSASAAAFKGGSLRKHLLVPLRTPWLLLLLQLLLLLLLLLLRLPLLMLVLLLQLLPLLPWANYRYFLHMAGFTLAARSCCWLFATCCRFCCRLFPATRYCCCCCWLLAGCSLDSLQKQEGSSQA